MKPIFVLAALAVTIDAHGGLAFPPLRNNHGDVNLLNFSIQTGSRIPGWQGGSCAGDMCLWINVGCFIGCQNCTSEISVVPGPAEKFMTGSSNPTARTRWDQRPQIGHAAGMWAIHQCTAIEPSKLHHSLQHSLQHSRHSSQVSPPGARLVMHLVAVRMPLHCCVGPKWILLGSM